MVWPTATTCCCRCSAYFAGCVHPQLADLHILPLGDPIDRYADFEQLLRDGVCNSVLTVGERGKSLGAHFRQFCCGCLFQSWANGDCGIF
jgi:hypothetical protein